MPRERALTRWLALVGIVLSGCSGNAVGPGGSDDGFADSDGVRLRYVIDFPEGAGPFPAVVYGPGSGEVGADNRHVVAHARRLVELGFAVVRYDKRGVGDSGGSLLNLSTANSATVVPQLAADMEAVLRAARSDERIDGQRLGLFGASQAAWYMPVVASMISEVRFVITLTGGVMPVGPKNHWEFLVFVEDRDPFSEGTVALWRTYDGPLGFDQRPLVRAFDAPMLYLFGEADRGVPFGLMMEEIGPLKTAGADLTVRSWANGTHLLDGIDFWPEVRSWLDAQNLD